MSQLKQRLIERIKSDGPITVAEYMTLCLLDPIDGYYPTRDPLGSDGDFITAPEISQMFGEVLGLWVIQSWEDLGSPKNINIVELGPGRGIMMADMLRVAKLSPDFLNAITVTLIEASAALEAVQAKTLADVSVPVRWIKDLSELSEGPMILIGNEYLDCLPIRQFIQQDPFAGRAGWHERVVSLNKDEGLEFALSPAPINKQLQASLPETQKDARKDQLLEISQSTQLLLSELKDRFDKNPGRALFIDYGPEETEFGDTLQALKRHKKIGVFDAPGDCDLTARVDFGTIKEFAENINLAVTAPIAQNQLLSRLGIEVRAVTLSKSNPSSKAKLTRQLERLMNHDQMGHLFKAICFQSKSLPLSLIHI